MWKFFLPDDPDRDNASATGDSERGHITTPAQADALRQRIRRFLDARLAETRAQFERLWFSPADVVPHESAHSNIMRQFDGIIAGQWVIMQTENRLGRTLDTAETEAANRAAQEQVDASYRRNHQP